MFGDLRWLVLYDDRPPFSSRDGGPEMVPARGVQIILQDHPRVGIETVTGADYYIWRKERWMGVDRFGMHDYLIEPGWKIVLFGRMLTHDEYKKIFLTIEEYKAGWLPREQKPNGLA